MSKMRTYVFIDARYASKVVHRIGKDRQTLDYSSLLSVLVNQHGCTISSAQYLAPKDSSGPQDTEEAARNRAKKFAYHKALATPEPNGPGLQIRELESRTESCRCPSCSNEFQVQVQNAIDVMIATQTLRYGLQGVAECIAVFAPDSSYIRAIKVAKARGVKIIAIGCKSDCTEMAALSDHQVWLEQIWEFVALTKKNAKPVNLADAKKNLSASNLAPDQLAPAQSWLKLPSDFSDIESGLLAEPSEDEVDIHYKLADAKKSTFDRRRETEDHGILMAEERRRRRMNGMISIEQEIEDRKIALQMQKEEHERAKAGMKQ